MIRRERESELAKDKYCSFTCYNAFRREHPETLHLWKGGKITTPCPVCGKPVSYREGTRNRRTSGPPYCSRRCAHVEFGAKMSGSRNPRWNDELRTRSLACKLARKYLGDVCAICGWCEGNCDAHHIDPVRKKGRNIVSNLIVLCPNCHRVTERGRWTQDELRAIWQERYGTMTFPPGVI